MTSKTLSTGTLSLKFMQNAHRAKQMKEVELDRAEVKDDGKWEVSKAIRDTWGLSEDASSQVVDVHEESYLPFLFSSEKGGTEPDANVDNLEERKATGRRVFNKYGMDVSQTASFTTAVPRQEAPPAAASTSAQPTKGRKVHPRPITISASGKSGMLKGFDQLKKPKDAKTAREAVFDTGNVGVDIRIQAKAEPPPSPQGFMKPVGIDDPKDLETKARGTASSSSVTTKDILERARKATVKRERDVASEDVTEVKKPKKKKKNVE